MDDLYGEIDNRIGAIKASEVVEDVVASGDFTCRIIFEDATDQDAAADILDKNGCDYDWDGGDRMMIGDAGLAVLDNAGIDYEEV